MRLRLALLVGLVLGGCAGEPSVNRTETFFPREGAIIPNTTLKLSPSTSIPLEKIVNWGLYAGVAYWVLDPLAPNWEIEETPLGDDHVHFSMKMKRYYAGGAGEARAVFRRRAGELARLNGFKGFEVMEYSEGLDSSLVGSQRTAVGVVRLTGKIKPKEQASPPA